MITSATSDDRSGERVVDARIEGDRLSVDLADGRTITAPVSWFPKLVTATPAQRSNWVVAGAGFGIHWPDLDEDLSVRGLLEGAAAPSTDASTN